MALWIDKIVSVLKGSAVDAFFLRNVDLDTDEELFKNSYKKSLFVYVCISTTAKAIAQVPLVISEFDEKKNIWVPVNQENQWQQLFDTPNQVMDGYQFKEALVGYLLLDGEVFVYPFPNTQYPVSLYIIRSKYIKEILDEKTNQLIGWWYSPEADFTTQGKKVPLALDEVCQMAFWNPYDPNRGLSPLEAARNDIEADWKAAIYNNTFFENGAVPGGVLSTDKRLREETFNRVKAQFEERHTGYKKGHKIAILEQGLKYTQSGLSQKDMEYLDLRKFSRQSIMQALGMKEAVISITDAVNYSTASEQRREWWESTNIPIMTKITHSLQRRLIKDSRYKVIFDTSNVEALHDRFADKVKTAVMMYKIGYPINMINNRLELGMPRVPWGDYWFMPNNVTPVQPNTEQQQLTVRVLPPTEDAKLFLSKKISRVMFEVRKKTLRGETDFTKEKTQLVKFIRVCLETKFDFSEGLILEYIQANRKRMEQLIDVIQYQVQGKDTKEIKSIFNRCKERADIVAEYEINKALSFLQGENNG